MTGYRNMPKKKNSGSNPSEEDEGERPAKEAPGDLPRYADRPLPKLGEPPRPEAPPAKHSSPKYGDTEPADPRRRLELDARGGATPRSEPDVPAATDDLESPRGGDHG